MGFPKRVTCGYKLNGLLKNRVGSFDLSEMKYGNSHLVLKSGKVRPQKNLN